jgi:hypothetical protein
MVAPTSTTPLQGNGAPIFVYDPRTLRYRDLKTGRFLAEAEVRAAVDSIIDKEAQSFRAIAAKLNAGIINLAEFHLQMESGVKRLHIAMALAGNGGVNNVSNADLGYIGMQIKKQYQFLNSLTKQIRNGTQKLDGTLLARVELYAQSARGTFEDTKRRSARNTGLQEEMRKLGPSDHCSGCLAEARKGWQPVGTLRRIGDTPCKGRCHCTFLYRRSNSGANS